MDQVFPLLSMSTLDPLPFLKHILQIWPKPAVYISHYSHHLAIHAQWSNSWQKILNLFSPLWYRVTTSLTSSVAVLESLATPSTISTENLSSKLEEVGAVKAPGVISLGRISAAHTHTQTERKVKTSAYIICIRTHLTYVFIIIVYTQCWTWPGSIHLTIIFSTPT